MSKILHAFTDGACNPNPGTGGWGWVFYQPIGKIVRFMDYGGKEKTTNNEMELTAMLECVRFLPSKGYPYKVIIHSDSEYTIKGMIGEKTKGVVGEDGRYHKWIKYGKTKRPNMHIWNQLHSECQRCHRDKIEIEIVWVKGHSGSEGNDLADKLAGMGIPK